MNSFKHFKKPYFQKDGPKRNFDRQGSHKAICSECGKECEVPFRPNGRKPVYCSSCYRRDNGTSPNRQQSAPAPYQQPQRPETYQKPELYQIKEKLHAMNVKLDKLISLMTDQSGTGLPPVQE